MNSRTTEQRKYPITGVEGFVGVFLALVASVIGNSSRIPAGDVSRFLEMRVTLLNVLFAVLFAFLWNACFRALDLHRWRQFGAFYRLVRLGRGCVLMSFLLVFYLLVTHTAGPTFRIAAIFFLLSFGYEIMRVLGSAWASSRDPQLVIILGSGRRAGKAWRELRTRHRFSTTLLGFVDDRPTGEMAPDVAARYLGNIDSLSEILLRNVVDELLIAVPMKSCYENAQRAISIAEQVGVRVVNMQDTYTHTLKQPAFQDQELFSELVPLPEDYMLRQAIKRVIDVVGSAIGLVLLSPVFLAVAVAIKLTSKGPVFFTQQRFGYRRRLFSICKFRSMVWNAPELMAQLESQNEAVGPIFKIKRDPRITRLGGFLRASSLDEIPQLWNVLLGNMSLVGPRPMSTRDVSLFSEAMLMRRFTVKPGITGLWQVSGRSGVTFDQWIKFDFHYIDDWSLALDFQILARTVSVVLKRTGAA